MRLFDLHCDTLLELYNKKETFEKNTCHISNEYAKGFEEYTQALAIWSINSLDADGAFESYKNTVSYFNENLKDNIKFGYRLAVEGGKLLGKDMSRLYRLKEDGVIYLTLVWGGECEIGGAHGTDTGLTAFGKDVVNECFDLGIVPDVSHASDKLFWDTARLFEKKGKPMLATHSNSRAVMNHDRNLTDDMYRFICESGGVAGISLYPFHLCEKDCTVDTIVRHIEHYLDIGGEDHICMGTDFDGIECTPEGINNLSELHILYDRLKELGYGEELTDKIFCKNAENYFCKF